MRTIQWTLLLTLFLSNLSVRGESEIEAEIANLEAAIADFKAEHGDLDALKGNIELAEQEIARAKEILPDLEEEIAKTERLRDIYRAAFRVVTTIQPETALGNLALKDGTTVEDAIYSGADGRGISVRTPSGPRTIYHALLPDSLHSQFNFPPSIDEGSASLRFLVSTKPELIGGDNAPVSVVGAESTSSSTPTQESAPAIPAQETKQQIAELRALAFETMKHRLDLENERNRKRTEFKRAKIKRAQVEIDEILADYERQIEALRQREKDIYAQILRIEAEM